MKQNVIEIENLTKDYGNGKGIFNINMSVKEGEIFGFLGPNGAGKTTTIRNLMGFTHPDQGKCSILGMDCEKESEKIKSRLGYLAGEIAFFDDMTGNQMIQFIAQMKGVTNRKRIQELIELFELDASGKINRMSKGMKQKIGIVTAFMNDAEVILLDEPTSGLDPLMQNRFIDYVLEQKKQGKTILMSSHIFEEVERTCDRTAIIRAGKIVAVEDMESLSSKNNKTFCVKFKDTEVAEAVKHDGIPIEGQKGRTLYFKQPDDINAFLRMLTKYPIKSLDVKSKSLEEIFLHYYEREEK